MMIECPACLASLDRKVIYRRGRCPVLNNVTYGTKQESVQSPVGTVELVACENCGMVFNVAFDEGLLSYGAHYDNSRDGSPAYCRYLDELAANMAQTIDRNDVIVEAGCGNGDFLVRLSRQTGAKCFGYDRAYQGEDRRDSVIFKREYFSSTSFDGRCDVLVLRHVLEHIPQPYTFLKGICDTDRLADDARIYVEVPDVEWIMRHGAFYDITYEHCNYFSKASLGSLVSSLGFGDIKLTNVFGGQYIFLEARRQSVPAADVARLGEKLDVSRWGGLLGEAQNRCLDIIRSGKGTCVWGASGKGVIFLSLLDDATLNHVSCVVDINPKKQGRFLPVSGKKVDSPDVLKEINGPMDVLIMNEIYQKEIEGLIKALGVVANTHLI